MKGGGGAAASDESPAAAPLAVRVMRLSSIATPRAVACTIQWVSGMQF